VIWHRTLPGARLAAWVAVLGVLLLAAIPVAAQEGQGAPEEEIPVQGVVTRIIEEGQREALGALQPYQTLEIRLRDGRVAEVHNSLSQGGPVGRLDAGDRVWLQPALDLEGRPSFFIVSRARSSALLWGFVALVVLVVLGLTGLVAPEDIFNGFSSNAVISIIATMILGMGLDRTGALNRLAAWLLRRSSRVAQARKARAARAARPGFTERASRSFSAS